jgi:fumarylacetoacetate (FAA) hydrolase family protein
MTAEPPATAERFTPEQVIPEAGRVGLWVGRAWLPAAHTQDRVAGPRPIAVCDGRALDLSDICRTTAELLTHDDPIAAIGEPDALPVLCELDALLDNSLFWNRTPRLNDCRQPCLLAPNDLQAVKACGVTFIQSLLERVVEERARGNPAQAKRVRAIITEALGDDLSTVEPGSPATVVLKDKLIDEGLWSQYLEVGIGPDAEIFTKCQPMAAVSFGAQVGVLPQSQWNNPEPEVVLAVSPTGRIQGATLGNDVNLRDYEGRSALLLGEAKDQNASCSIGPFIRLFDDSFDLETLLSGDVHLSITGADGFASRGTNRLGLISRHPRSLVAQACNRNHQYPDGFMLFLGTMFAPVEDRLGNAGGFTHQSDDRVEIAHEHLGTLVNWVNHTNRVPEWTFGTLALIENLLARQKVDLP